MLGLTSIFKRGLRRILYNILYAGVAVPTEGFVALACGSQHGAVVVDGDVITWGRAQGGRLGQGDIIEVRREGGGTGKESRNRDGKIKQYRQISKKRSSSRCTNHQ